MNCCSARCCHCIHPSRLRMCWSCGSHCRLERCDCPHDPHLHLHFDSNSCWLLRRYGCRCYCRRHYDRERLPVGGRPKSCGREHLPVARLHVVPGSDAPCPVARPWNLHELSHHIGLQSPDSSKGRLRGAVDYVAKCCRLTDSRRSAGWSFLRSCCWY